MSQPSNRLAPTARELIFTAAVTVIGKGLFPKAPILSIAACSCLCQQGYSLIEKSVGALFKTIRTKTDTLAPSKRLEKTTAQLIFTTAGIGAASLFIGIPQSPVQLAVFPIAFLVKNYATQYFSYPSRTLRSMTLEEQVAQLLIVHFQGEVPNNAAKELVQNMKVGGIIYYNFSNGELIPSTARALSDGLQELALCTSNRIPLVIAADQEGGLVSRFTKGYTIFPGNSALGKTRDLELVKNAAFVMGKEARAVGLNTILGPVGDVNNNKKNPVIGIRSFGEETEMVADCTEKAIEGFHEAGEATTMKHFPGYGDVECDPHDGLPTIKKTLDQLKQVEFSPFVRAAQSTDIIMTAHLLVPALDSENCSTFSEKTVSYLKNKIGYDGLIMTDSLVMGGALSQSVTVEEGAKRALNAGHHFLLLGGKALHQGQDTELNVQDMQRIHRFLVNAVKKGEIPKQRVEQAVHKILTMKERICFSTASLPRVEQLGEVMRTEPHLALARNIAERAITVEHNTKFAFSPAYQKIALFAPEILRDAFQETDVCKNPEPFRAHFFQTLNPSLEDVETAAQIVQESDALILCSYNAWKNPRQAASALFDLGKPVIVFVTRDPCDAPLFPKAQVILNTRSPTTPSLQAALDWLKVAKKWG